MGTKINKAVFIDRDGTIARDVHYCSRPADFELLPGAAEGVRLLTQDDFKVVVVTNQSGIARGYFTEETLGKIHAKMHRELAKHGARVDAIYYCPHHPDDNCECRKPKPKMLLQAASDLDIDLGQSYVIGDKLMDVEMGSRAGCRSILIAEVGKEDGVDRQALYPDYIASSISTAAEWIIAGQGQELDYAEMQK